MSGSYNYYLTRHDKAIKIPCNGPPSRKEALPIFYTDYKLQSDGGVDDSAVKIELFKGVFLYIPNFETRKKVILKHDIHHLLTGYPQVMERRTRNQRLGNIHRLHA